MGDVYRARHRKLGGFVALKVLNHRRAATPEASAGFLREMEALGQLEHPNVVEALYAGESDGTFFLVMKLVAGTDLEKLVAERGPLPVAEACELARQAALGLAYLHARGIVHRDVKPSNLIRSAGGPVKILDLGLALLKKEGASEGETQAGAVLGTPDYLAPEQAQNPSGVDGGADLYSLGATLYFLLAGKPPFAHHSGLMAKLCALEREPPPDLRRERPDLPEGLAILVGSLLAKRPEDRPTAAAVAVALASWAEDWTGPGATGPGKQTLTLPPSGQSAPRPAAVAKSGDISLEASSGPSRKRPRWPWVAAAAVLLAGGLVWALTRPGSRPPPAPAGAEPLKGFIDLVVVEPGNPRRQYVWLTDPASRPLRAGDVVFVQAELNRPAYCYVVWVDAEGKVQPIYPWLKGDWKLRREERPMKELKLPDLKVDNQWALEPGPPGWETLVLLTRETPLPVDADLESRLGEMGPQTLPKGDVARLVAWFENGMPVQEKNRDSNMGERKLGLDGESVEPVLRTQERIEKRVGDLFGYTRAAAFPNVGGK
jgi:hypothetical protein